ncbi:MAG: PD-(D/E)XK nuclease family protein, partial [Sphingobacterium sp.]
VIPKLLMILENLLQSMATQQRIKQIDSNLLIEARKVLNQLKLGFDKLGHLSIGFQIGLIKKAIAPINSAIEGDPLTGLQIMGILESRCLNFDNIYILGANEGVLPKTSSSPTFLADSLRKAFELPVLANQDALSAYLFYRHFQFSQGIHLFYNGIVDQQSTGEESRFIKQLEFETNFNIIKHTQQQTIQFPKQSEELLLEKTGVIWDKLYQDYLVSGRKISASALTCYLQSPMQFFLKYVADIKEPPAITQEFEMNKLGIIIHGSMERLLTPLMQAEDFQPTNLLKAKIDLVDQTVLQEISSLYQSNYLSLADLSSLQVIMHRIACEYVKMYLQYDIENYASIRIIELENDRDYTIPFPIIVNGEEKNVTLFGIIDRVDEVITKEGLRKIRIVDYKT